MQAAIFVETLPLGITARCWSEHSWKLASLICFMVTLTAGIFMYCLLYLLSFISCSCLPYWLTREEWVGLHVVWLILLDSGAVVGSDIPGCTVIGHRNTIGYNAVVGVKCQDMKYKVVILLLTLYPKCNFGSNAVTVDSFWLCIFICLCWPGWMPKHSIPCEISWLI